jgi:CRP-like cAMP-binding protein
MLPGLIEEIRARHPSLADPSVDWDRVELDQRLADYLLGHGRIVHATHQALAEELGTVREMVTRLLNRFESAGSVKLGRERIEILDAVALRAIASGDGLSR